MGQLIKHADIFSAESSLMAPFTGGGFAVLSPKGSKWRIKHKGEETMILDPDGDPKSTVEVVVIDAATHLSKTYYKSGYTEGSSEPPDCQSVDATVPDPASTSPQSANCAGCAKNQFGSRITPAGKKGKACADSLRLAVVPAGSIVNEDFGGSMLLRVSATAIASFQQYNNLLRANGKSFRAVVTRIGFDPDASYPRLVFKRGRDLTEDEREQVVTMYSRNEALARILSDPAQPRDDDDETPAPAAPAVPAPKAVASKPAALKPKAAPKPVEPPPEESTGGGEASVGDDLDAMLADLDLDA